MSEHELWNELGNLYFMSGAFDQAAFAYHRSIQIDRGFGRPYSNLGLTCVQQGRYDEAIHLYKKSLDLLSDDREKAVSWIRLGNVYRRMKEYEQAVQAYQQADTVDPDLGAAREASDRILYGSPAPTISRDELLEMTKTVPNHDQVDLSAVTPPESAPAADEPPLTLVTRQEPAVDTVGPEMTEAAPAEPQPEETAEAEETLDLSVFFEDETEIYYPELDADALGEWLPIPEPLQPEARSEPEPVHDPEPEAQGIPVTTETPLFERVEGWIPATPLLAASAAPGAGSDASTHEAGREESVPALKFVELDIDDPVPGMYTVAENPAGQDAGSQLPDPAPARAERPMDEAALNIELEIPKLRRLVQVNPRNAVTWNTLGNLYKSAGSYREAIMAYQQATSIDPDKAEYYHNLGMVYGAEGRDEDAIIALQKVLELKPDHSLTHATLGGYYQKLGFEELAQKHIGKAMKHIYDSESEYNRACLEAICGNTDQAIDLLRVALENKQTYVDWVLRDPDLDMIREDRRFKQLISDFT